MSEEDKGQWFDVPSGSIEYIEPNLSLIYSELAPLVAEAWAYMDCNHPEKCREALRKARCVVADVSMRMAVFKPDVKPPVKEPGTTFKKTMPQPNTFSSGE